MRVVNLAPWLLAVGMLPLGVAWGGDPPFRMVQGGVDAALVVTDSPSSRAWYEALLRVPPTPAAPSKTSDGGLMFRYKHGASFIKLVEHSPTPPKYDGQPDSAVGFRWLRIAMVAPLDLPKNIAALGGRDRVIGPDSSGEWTLIDPDGNRVYASTRDDPGYEIEIGLVVRSLEDATRFYGETLGLSDGGPAGADHVFWAGRSRLVLRQASSSSLPKRTGVRKEIAGIRFVTFPIEDVHALAVTLANRGVLPVWGPAPPRPESPVILLFIEDPDGNWVEFYSMRKQPQ
jgi:catechol 2,3-dioxygenase-like lactoylglutathione lyase family enzyme